MPMQGGVLIPPFWETLLKRYVKKTFYTDTRKRGFAERGDFTEGDYRFFSNGVRKLNVAFTLERHALPNNYFNQKEFRSGYLLYFLPVNALKVAALLSELPQGYFLQEGVPLKILDVGSGPGTGMMGVMLHLQNLIRRAGAQFIAPLRLHWTLVDQNRQALEDARLLHDEILSHLKKEYPGWTIESRLQIVVGNFFSEHLRKIVLPEPYDLILALNFLSELPRQKRLPIVEGLLRNYLQPKGKMLIMEPALRQTTRDLMKLHDEILERESGHVYAPCLHQASCPMLKINERDWCHTYIPWERPPWIEKIDRLVGIRKDHLKCSYLLLGREKINGMDRIVRENPVMPPVMPKDQLWRVVSGPLNSKGKTERLLCGPAGLPGLLRVMRLDKDETPANRDFGSSERGDIVRAPRQSRISRDTQVRKIGITASCSKLILVSPL